MSIAPYKLSPGGVLTLYDIYFDSCIAFKPTGTTRLSISPYRNGELDVIYQNIPYRFVGVQASGFRSEMNASAPKPLLVFDKASLYLNPIYIDLKSQFKAQTGQTYFDWRGAKVTITKYYVNGDETIYQQEFIVEQVSTVTESTLEVNLAVSLSIDNLNSDSVQKLSMNRCSLKYRQWNETTQDFDYTPNQYDGCPYGNPTTPTDYSAVPNFGIKYFTAEDQELLAANKKFDDCSQSVKGCQIRFDPLNQGLNLPFKGLYSPTSKLGPP
jgi:phage-related protein